MNLSNQGLTSMKSNPDADSLGGLYQEIIVEHSRRPRHKGPLSPCQFCQEGKNPLCGDEVNVFARVEQHAGAPARVFVSFDGHGCSISQASASMMCDAVNGQTFEDALSCLDKAEDIYSGTLVPADSEDPEHDFEALAGVAKFPVRIKCAALAWKSLELLLSTHFDEHGKPLQSTTAATEAAPKRKLKIITHES